MLAVQSRHSGEQVIEAQGDRPKVAVLWVHFGAYHMARLRALAGRVRLYPIELAGDQELYRWSGHSRSRLGGVTLWAGSYERANRLRLAYQTWKALARENPEVVLIPGYSEPAALAAAMWARAHGRKAILMSDSTILDQNRSAWKEVLKQKAVRNLYDAAIVSGKRAARYAESLGIRRERIAFFYDVVDNEHFAPRGSNRTATSAGNYFLYVGRMAACKNAGKLLESFDAYRARGGRWELFLAGDGPLRKELESFARNSPHENQIRFLGNQSYDALPDLYANAGCLILPSTSEPWGLVVNEAMASGLPVIVSDRCGCVEDLVEDGSNGFAFDPLSPFELTELMFRISSLSETERRVMGCRSMRIIQRFSLDTWAAEVERIVHA